MKLMKQLSDDLRNLLTDGAAIFITKNGAGNSEWLSPNFLFFFLFIDDNLKKNINFTHRNKRERVLLLAHSRIFFFSQPSTVLTHSSPGLRQSLEMNGISLVKLVSGNSRGCHCFFCVFSYTRKTQAVDNTTAIGNCLKPFRGSRVFDSPNLKCSTLALPRIHHQPRMALFNWRHLTSAVLPGNLLLPSPFQNHTTELFSNRKYACSAIYRTLRFIFRFPFTSTSTVDKTVSGWRSFGFEFPAFL